MNFAEIVAHINTYVAGWAAYYGRFYKSGLYAAFRGLNVYLMRWAMRKYKSLKHSRKKAWAWLRGVEQRAPGMFAHWRLGVTVSSQ
jgi:RNA-directed DNA polymerase